MADNFIPVNEPQQFAAGDTLSFQKYLPRFLPSDGWALTYTLTDAVSGKMAAQVQSASTDGTNHTIYQEVFANGLQPGPYEFQGEAINAGTGEKHQIYYSGLKLTPDLTDNLAPGTLLSEAQQMLKALFAQYTALLAQLVQESDVNRSRFLRKKQSDVLADIKYWKEVRFSEICAENAANGKTPPNVQNAVFAIL